MDAKRRLVLGGVTLSVAGLAAGHWIQNRPSQTERVISNTVRLSFGNDIMVSNELRVFSLSLSPLIERAFPAEQIASADTDLRQFLRRPRIFSDPQRLENARQVMGRKHYAISELVALEFVQATDFIFDPNAAQVAFLGMRSVLFTPFSGECSHLMSAVEDDGWPT